MKRKLFFALAVLCYGIAFAQQWAPAGAEWTYGVAYAFSPQVNYKVWLYDRDTTIAGHTCKVIQRTGSYVSGDLSDNLITYEDSGVVYWYYANQFTVLYDFNKQAGDSWTIMIDSCSLDVTVDTTGTDTINNRAVRWSTISTPNGAFNGTIIEGIGHTVMPNPNIIYHCFGAIEDMNYYTGLRCYEDSTLWQHSFGSVPCNYTITSLEKTAPDMRYNVFPNPACDQTAIVEKSGRLYSYVIYNSQGQVIQRKSSQTNTSIIDLAAFTTGVYEIEITEGGQPIHKRLLVQKQ